MKRQNTRIWVREGSRYEQYFFQGRKVRAETLYHATVGSESMSVEEVAMDYDVPVVAVLEAIQYAVENAALLQREREKTGKKATPEVLLNRLL